MMKAASSADGMIDAVPMQLRLRGTFIDFCPYDKSSTKRVRSKSAPAKVWEGSAPVADEYLTSLIDRAECLPQLYTPEEQSGHTQFQSEEKTQCASIPREGDPRIVRLTHESLTHLERQIRFEPLAFFDLEDYVTRRMGPDRTMLGGFDDGEADYDFSSSDEDTEDMSTDYPESWESVCSMHSDSASEQECKANADVGNLCELRTESLLLEEASNSPDELEPITTLMVCDIPCNTREQELVDAFNNLGFANTYDFLCMPGKQWGRRDRGKLSHAFVNFKTAEYASQFSVAFKNYAFPGHSPIQFSYVKAAACQGYQANVQMHTSSKCFQKQFLTFSAR
jgi:hypothetical protein